MFSSKKCSNLRILNCIATTETILITFDFPFASLKYGILCFNSLGLLVMLSVMSVPANCHICLLFTHTHTSDHPAAMPRRHATSKPRWATRSASFCSLARRRVSCLLASSSMSSGLCLVPGTQAKTLGPGNLRKKKPQPAPCYRRVYRYPTPTPRHAKKIQIIFRF